MLFKLIVVLFAFSQANAFNLKPSWPISHDYWRDNVVKSKYNLRILICYTLFFKLFFILKAVNRTECVFFGPEKVFSCAFLDTTPVVIDCPAVANFTGLDVQYFGHFAIGLERGVDLKIDVNGVYNLYPTLRDHRGYMSHFIPLHGETAETNLFFMSKTATTRYGIGIKDQTCFSSIINHFVASKNLVKECRLNTFLVEQPVISHFAKLWVLL